ncbi:unnamed protein product [Trichogramma brassicae]|uniref:Reverse transcriptase domain-containing protein n=1 Tax=Trichogramma brassicae TaxID=86971 RepID=A0A6H5IR03_9HYME|nr:unnamed protein product [Trichogramma brassicae]
MNTREIEYALRGLNGRSVGVFASDRVPHNVSLPAYPTSKGLVQLRHPGSATGQTRLVEWITRRATIYVSRLIFARASQLSFESFPVTKETAYNEGLLVYMYCHVGRQGPTSDAARDNESDEHSSSATAVSVHQATRRHLTIFKIRTRRYKKTKNAKDKEKFNDDSSSGSLHPAQKFEAIEEISNDGNSDVDADGDVSMLPLPERTAKARAREKIAEIVNAGKRQLKPAVPPQAPAMQVENLDLQRTEWQSACGDDLISFQEDPCDSTPASASSQSSIENNNSQFNAVLESILDSNKQEYAGRFFPEIVQEKSPERGTSVPIKIYIAPGSARSNFGRVTWDDKAPPVTRRATMRVMSTAHQRRQYHKRQFIVTKLKLLVRPTLLETRKPAKEQHKKHYVPRRTPSCSESRSHGSNHISSDRLEELADSCAELFPGHSMAGFFTKSTASAGASGTLHNTYDYIKFKASFTGLVPVVIDLNPKRKKPDEKNHKVSKCLICCDPLSGCVQLSKKGVRREQRPRDRAAEQQSRGQDRQRLLRVSSVMRHGSATACKISHLPPSRESRQARAGPAEQTQRGMCTRTEVFGGSRSDGFMRGQSHDLALCKFQRHAWKYSELQKSAIIPVKIILFYKTVRTYVTDLDTLLPIITRAITGALSIFVKTLEVRTLPDRYPVRHIHDFSNDIDGFVIFSTIVLVKAYQQIPVHADDICKTAITTPFSLYEFPFMTFGLKNAGQTFQRFMDEVTRGLPFCFVYIDEILVYSRSNEEHRQHLRQLFARLHEYSLVLNTNKSKFGLDSVQVLGYTVSADGIRPPAERIQESSTTLCPRRLKACVVLSGSSISIVVSLLMRLNSKHLFIHI